MGVDLGVIGGGIIGLAAAHRAAVGGATVVVHDATTPGRATDAGAGIVSCALNTRDQTPLVDLAIAGCLDYPELLAEVAHGLAGHPDLDQRLAAAHSRVGILDLALTDDDRTAFDRRAATVTARMERSGHPTGHRVTPLDGDGARARHPLLESVVAALHDDGAARVDGRLVAALLREAAVAAGAEIRTGRAESVADVAAEADAVLIAGGAWSARFAQELGLDLPVAPQRGQIAHLRLPDDASPGTGRSGSSASVDSGAWPMLSLPADQYQVAWPGGRVAVGATRETGSGFAPVVTAGGVRHVLDHALRATPALAAAEVVEVRVGLRPATPDGMPFVGAVRGHERVTVVTGHGPIGLTTGPVSARRAVDRILGRHRDPVLEPLGLNRTIESPARP